MPRQLAEHFLVCRWRVSQEEISRWIGRLSKEDCPPQGAWVSFSSLRAWIERKGRSANLLSTWAENPFCPLTLLLVLGPSDLDWIPPSAFLIPQLVEWQIMASAPIIPRVRSYNKLPSISLCLSPCIYRERDRKNIRNMYIDSVFLENPDLNTYTYSLPFLLPSLGRLSFLFRLVFSLFRPSLYPHISVLPRVTHVNTVFPCKCIRQLYIYTQTYTRVFSYLIKWDHIHDFSILLFFPPEISTKIDPSTE